MFATDKPFASRRALALTTGLAVALLALGAAALARGETPAASPPTVIAVVTPSG